MAQTKKKRKRKKRGTQAGAIDNRRKARPKNRAEARNQAKGGKSGSAKGGRSSVMDRPPTWKGAAFRGLIAASVFTLILLVGFGKGFGYSIGIGLGMLVLYVPAGYYMDIFLWRRRERARIRARDKG